MGKKIVVLCIMVSLIGAFAFAGGQGEEAEQAEEGKKQHYNLVFSSNASPKMSHGQAAEVFAEEIEKMTDGQITVETYLSGSLSTQEGQLPACRKGTIDMTMGGPNWFAEYVPYIKMFAAGYIFEDYDHMTKVMNGEIGKRIEEDLVEEAGVRMMTTMYLGTRQINLRDIGRVVKTPADMEGVKIRMPNTESWQFMGEALGAQPTPMAISEVYLGMKNGTVDGQDNPLPTDITRKFYEVSKYIILTSHYVNPIIPIINEDTWQMLGPDLQEKVRAAWDKAREYCDTDVQEREANAREKLEAEGMTFVEVDQALWKDHVLNFYLDSEKMSGDWDMDLYDEVLAAAE